MKVRIFCAGVLVDAWIVDPGVAECSCCRKLVRVVPSR